MKIKSFLTVGLIFALLMTSCGGEELEEPTSRNYETYNGEFMSLGSIKVNKTITHMFETDDGDILYAYSDRYDLDDDEYFGQRIEAYGVVMGYESLDKDLFEVKRITEADEEEDDDENVEDVEYKDTDLGVSFTYPDNWTLTALRDAIQLEAPLPESSEEEEEVEVEPDYVIVSGLGEVLSSTSGDDQTTRAADIKSYVSNNYENFVGISASMSYIGEDQVFAIKYRTENDDTSYFVPRGAELIELSFFHPDEADGDKLKNSNIFAEIVASFRFLPYGDEEVDEEELVEEEEVVIEEEEEVVVETPSSGDQVSVSSYVEFESNPYKFKISYPGSWYYAGGNGGYDFDDESIEDDTDPIIRLDLNTRSSEGVSTSGSNVEVTVLVDDRYYTLTGPAEYQDIMQYMADSIVAVETE